MRTNNTRHTKIKLLHGNESINSIFSNLSKEKVSGDHTAAWMLESCHSPRQPSMYGIDLHDLLIVSVLVRLILSRRE